MLDPKTADLIEQKEGKPNLTIDYGDGPYIFDTNGKRYLDAVSGIHVANIGHGVADVVDAMTQQAKRIAFVNKRQFSCEQEQRLANMILDVAPKNMGGIQFVSSGSEANEAALHIVRRYQSEVGFSRKTRIIGRWHSYHGNTIATLSMGGHLSFRKKITADLLPFPHIPAPHCYRCPYRLNYPTCDLACAKELEIMIQQENADTIAAFIAEPIVGTTGGAIVPPDGYYEIIRTICDKYNVLFISDEVITGFGRTGEYFGINHWQATPDIIVAGKGLGCGYSPICSVIVSQKIRNVIFDFKGGIVAPRATFGGNPVSCATALAAQEYIKKHDLISQCKQIGTYLLENLQKLKERTSVIGNVRGRGLLLGVEFVQDKSTKQTFPRKYAFQEKVVWNALNNGLILTGGTGTGVTHDGDHILISPPFTISKNESDFIVKILEKSINDALIQTKGLFQL